MATKSTSPFLSGSSGSLFGPRAAKKQSGTTLDDLLRQNDSSRQKLSEAGYKDPTREVKPSMLERIFGPLDALGTGVRGLVYNAVSDENVDVWDEMGKALNGEDRVEGADILEELGVDNKWGQMLGGFAVDMLLDPLTYLTLGYGAAAKAGGKGLLSAVVKYGDNVDDIVRAAGYADDAVKGAAKFRTAAAGAIDALKSGGFMDEAGNVLDIGKMSAKQSQEIMTTLYKQFGRGGVKFAGIPLGGDELMSKLGYAIKGTQVGDKATGLRKLPGSRWIEGTFGHGGTSMDVSDVYRRGNEVLNTLAKGGKDTMVGHWRLFDQRNQQVVKEIMEAAPDEYVRKAATVAYSMRFGDDAPQIASLVDEYRQAVKIGDAVAQDKAMDAIATLREAIEPQAASRVTAILKDTFGLADDQIAQASKALDIYQGRMQELYTMRKRLASGEYGMRVGVFGDDAAGYIPGIGKTEWDDIDRQVIEAMGLDPNSQVTQDVITDAIDTGKRKSHLTTEDRLTGAKRDLLEPSPDKDEGLSKLFGFDLEGKPLTKQERLRVPVGEEATPGLITEMDLAKLFGIEGKKQGGKVVLGQLEDELVESGINRGLARKIAEGSSDFFTRDESTKGFLKVYDSVQNWWKKQATVLRFPAFQGRNGLSNKVLMYQDDLLSVAGEKKSLELIGRLQKATKGGVVDPSLLTGADRQLFDELLEDGILSSFDELAELTGAAARKDGAVMKALASVNTIIENQSRMSAYFTALNKGIGRKGAAEMVNKALFNYSGAAYSTFERNVVMRLTPFFKFTKSNLTKQVRNIATTPGKSTWLGHLMESGGAAADIDTSNMPEWLRELNPIQTPLTFRGNPVMISTEGLFPQNDLELIGKVVTGELNANDALSFLSPLLRTPLEIVMNKDVYYDEDLQAYEGEKKRAPGYVEEFGDIANAVPGLREAWGLMTNALGIQERTGKDGEDYYWMDARANKILKDALPWMNQVAKYVGGADPDKTVLDRWSATGVKPIKYDTEQFEQNKAYEDRDALMDALAKMRDEATAKPGLTLQDIFGGR